MDRSVIGLFDTLAQAQAAINELANAGFGREYISLIAYDPSNEYARYIKQKPDISTNPNKEDAVTGSQGAGFGAVIGGLTGILVGIGALVIPGIGPIIVAGPLLSTLTGGAVGAAAGAATGGITASLLKTGVSEEEAQYYTEGVRRGGTLVVLGTDTEANAQHAADILANMGAVDVNTRVDMWKKSGWTFDANA